MSDKFTVEIITPDETILKSDAYEVTIPSFEGNMGILNNHIPLITFLRPGIILIKNQTEKKFFVEEGTVEFSDNSLLILTSAVRDLKNFDKVSIDNLIKDSENKIKNNNLSDKDHYIESFKLNTLKEINQ